LLEKYLIQNTTEISTELLITQQLTLLSLKVIQFIN